MPEIATRDRKFEITLFIVLLATFVACTNSQNQREAASRVPEPDLISRLKAQKATIDTFYSHKKGKIVEFIKRENSDSLVEGTDEDYDDTEATYTMLSDSSGKILTASEFPFSKSGDWYIVVSHYFDREGNTFAVERQTNFFNNGCTDGPAYETITRYYDQDLTFIDSTYRLVDSKNKPLAKDSCAFLYNYNFKPSTNVEQWVGTRKIRDLKFRKPR